MKKIKTDKNYDIIVSFKVTDHNGTVTNQAVVVENVCGADAAKIVKRDLSADDEAISFQLMLAFAESYHEDNFDQGVSAGDIHFLLQEHGKYPLKKLHHLDSGEIIEWTASDAYRDRWLIDLSDEPEPYEYNNGIMDSAAVFATYYGKDVDIRVA